MGRLSTFAKNRILNLRFQKSYRIKQIAQTLLTEDNIKVSRKSISTFLKKYIETKSINDKPRSGRNKKLTPEEINLIGEVTRLNRDITAPKIKEYLNLNVSTYTILRASKLFEWNKLNPNSNEAKRQAALERQLNGEAAAAAAAATAAADANKSKSSSKNRKQQAAVLAAAAAAAINSNSVMNNTATIGNNGTMTTVKLEKRPTNKQTAKNKQISADDHYDPEAVMHLDLVPEADIAFTKNISSSPMVFATKILYKIFKMDELIGHNVSGKTFNKFIKNKKALDEKRVNYIRYLVEKNFDASDREELWKSCRTAINKCIRNNEIKYAQAIGVPPNNLIIFQHKEELSGSEDMNDDSLIRISCPPTTTTTSSSTTTATTNGGTTLTLPLISEDDATPTRSRGTTNTIVTLQPNMSIFQMSDEIVEPPSSSQQQPPHGLLLEDGTTTLVTLGPSSQRVMTRSAAAAVAASTTASPQVQPTIIKLTDIDKDFDDDCKALLDLNNKSVKSDNESDEDMEESSGGEQLMTTNEDGSNRHHHVTLINNKLNHLVSSSELDEMRNQCCCSPMIFATKVLLRIFTKDELIGHNVSGKTYHKNLKNKQPLDEQRIEYIRSLVEAYFPQRKIDVVWKACRKAINRVIRNFEIKESKLNKSIDDDVDEIDFLIYSNSGTAKK